MTTTDTSWMERAACKGLYGLFFPERGESLSEPRAVCASCPVRAECDAYATAGEEKWGVWAGKSERQRRKERSERSAVERACAAEGCEQTFTRPSGKGSPKIYCSTQCAQRTYYQNKARRQRALRASAVAS